MDKDLGETRNLAKMSGITNATESNTVSAYKIDLKYTNYLRQDISAIPSYPNTDLKHET